MKRKKPSKQKRKKPARKRRSPKHRAGVTQVIDYYQRPFDLLHVGLHHSQFDPTLPPGRRQTFWQVVPPDTYGPVAALELLQQYSTVIESEMASIVQRFSIGRWLHLYRRLSPDPIGPNTTPTTINLTRAALEAAFQKYGQHTPCRGVGLSGEIPLGQILGGLLLSPEFAQERRLVQRFNQLVLTEFSQTDLAELYNLERLAYEIWSVGAHMRGCGKGASIVVGDFQELFGEDRTDELDTLIKRYDVRTRAGSIYSSTSGTVFESNASGISLPSYNVERIELGHADSAGFLAEAFNVRLAAPVRTNFIWWPFDIGAYYRSHLPFAEAFRDRHEVTLVSVLGVVAALGSRALFIWRKEGVTPFFHFWQRAYEGPHTRAYVLDQLSYFVEAGKRLLGATDDDWKGFDLEAGIAYWELSASSAMRIDLVYSGPHYIFLPFGDRLFIDYAWVRRRLVDLFFGITLDDQDFKGVALEEVLRRGGSLLPAGQCISGSGERKQIDAAFRLGSRLVVVECRAAGRSIAFERGAPEATAHRLRVVEKALADAGDKAQWLARNPVGRNYDISWAREILPLAVTPFKEFISSLSPYYWLDENLPRVLSPNEFAMALEQGLLASVADNLVAT